MYDLPLPAKRSSLAPLLAPIDAFFSAESAGGIVLIIAAIAAIVWANSPWHDSYHALWHAHLAITAGTFTRSMSLEHWVNDGLMVFFFLLVGLEIKRELVVGELASVRRAALPIAAAVGGMVAPALIYAIINRGGRGAAGWGIPMATDIAFAVGVLALVGRSVPTSAKVFLLAIAIVDDLGAVLVIALFYTSQINFLALGIAAAILAALVLLNALHVHRPLPYMLLGVGLWIATLYSGLHATIAGVLLAFTIPATRQIEEAPFVNYMKAMLDIFAREATVTPERITPDQSHALNAMEQASQAVQMPLARVEHALLKPVNFLIIPLFALANAGVDLRSGGASALGSPVMWGSAMGLLIGKPAGVLIATWLIVKTGFASLPERARWRNVIGLSILCGIGFTMSLFVANLAFPGADVSLAGAKVGILAASIIAGAVGGVILATGKRPASVAT